MNTPDLAARLRALEDLEAIRRLKARYFLACDRKDPAAMRDCFCSGEVLIDYGPVGTFGRREQLVEVFERLACHAHIVEMHHGANPCIEIVDAQRARGTWALHYQQIDTQAQRLTQLGGLYDDAYRKDDDGAWRIERTRFVVGSTLVLDLPLPPPTPKDDR
jgi:hypothetical protein